MSPKFSPSISLGQKWKQRVLWREIAYSQGEALHALKVPGFFPFGLGWGGEVLFWFLLIGKVSHQILNGLSSCSQLILHDFVIFIKAFPIAPLLIPYELTNVILLTVIEGPKSRNSTLTLWGVIHVYSLSDKKVFVSYHGHFRLQWKIYYTIKLYLDSHLPQLTDMNQIIGSIYCIESTIAY